MGKKREKWLELKRSLKYISRFPLRQDKTKNGIQNCK